MRFVAFALALLGWIGSAHADVTITNFNGLGTAYGNTVATRDIYGNALDAHSSHILTVAGTYYLIGEAHGCGFRPGNVGTACGLSVYSSPDLVNWTSHGLLIDANVAPWSTICAASGSISFPGCYRPQMVYNAANNNYVLWIQTPATTSAATIATCTTPLGPCTKQADPTHIAHAGVGDFALFVDAGGTAYLIYRFQGTNEIYIDSLTSDYLDSTGTSVDTGGSGEAPQMFSDAPTGGSKYYAVWSDICAYCGPGSGPVIHYRSASTALGTYSASTTLNATGCSTQPASVDVITAGGQTNYVYRGDAWLGLDNEGLANYYTQPLTVSGGAITPFSCNATVTILGVTLTSPSSPWPAVDQSNYPSTNGFWQGYDPNACVISNAKWCLQTFIPTKASLASVGMALGMGNGSCGVPSACPTPDGSLVADLVTVDGSYNVVSVVATVTLPVAQLKWAPQFTLLGFNQTGLTPGNKYGVVLKPSGLTVTGGFFSVSYDNASDNVTTGSYPSGKFRKSTDSGVTWADNGTNPQAALFSTFPTIPLRGGNMMLH